jgi:pectate lyase
MKGKNVSKIALLTAFALTLTVIGGCMADEKAPEQTKIDISKLPAFPGAEGYGALTIGGRGGKVIAVTNLNDSGPGSLRAAIEAEGPRTVVFRVSGTIALDSPLHIRQPNLTIAGQTAPGDGICIKRYPLMIRASDIIIRYIRVRFGDESGTDADAISGRYFKNIILDHVSASWSVDETLSVYHCENVTIQWCLISESMHYSKQSKGVHGFGAIWGSNYSTYHHNLLAHHSSRNPRFASGCGYNDYRNNVVYNWGYNSCYGGEARQEKERRDTPVEFSSFNMVANYYKPGPATVSGKTSWRIVNPSTRAGVADLGKWYVAGNYVHGSPAVTADNWKGGVQVKDEAYLPALKLDKPWDAMPIRQQTAEEAYHAVLKYAGASLPRRDAVDARVIEETRTGTATYEGTSYRERLHTHFTDSTVKLGIIDSQADVRGWPELKGKEVPIRPNRFVRRRQRRRWRRLHECRGMHQRHRPEGIRGLHTT